MNNWFSENQSIGTKFSYKIERVIFHGKSNFQSIQVLESKDSGRLLILDGILMLSERFEPFYHEAISHFPLFSHSNPTSILIIGGGDGGSARECLKHNSVKRIDLCEIDKKVIDVSIEYLPFVGKSLKDSRVNIINDDGFLFLGKNNNNLYDIIIVDSTDPEGPASTLFTKKFYQRAKNHLNPNGILCTIATTPYCESKLLLRTHSTIRSVFNNVRHYIADVPMYQSGNWTFIMASNERIMFRQKRYFRLIKNIKCKYYDNAIHKAAFTLPLFYKKMLKALK